MSEYVLAQVNIGRLKAPLDDPALQSFVTRLGPVNASADVSDGFIWRLKTEDGNATAIRIFSDDMLLVNLSVWESVETLQAWVYGSMHAEMLKQRRSWFEQMRESYTALWWIPRGATPTVADAEERLLHLRANGPSPFAFTFKAPFPAPDHALTLGE